MDRSLSLLIRDVQEAVEVYEDMYPELGLMQRILSALNEEEKHRNG